MTYPASKHAWRKHAAKFDRKRRRPHGGLLFPKRRDGVPSKLGIYASVMSGRRPLSRASVKLCERLGCGHVFGLFTRGLRPAGPDDSSAWLFASITVSRSIWRRHCSRLPSLIRWFTSLRGHPRLRIASRRSSLVDSSPQAAIGRSSYEPPRVRIAKTMRATLLASATAVSLNLYLTALRSSSEEAHTRKAS